MNVQPEQARHELDAIQEAARAIGVASNVIGRRLITSKCPPGSAEISQLSDWQAKLRDITKELRGMALEAGKNVPRAARSAAPEFTARGALGATFTGD